MKPWWYVGKLCQLVCLFVSACVRVRCEVLVLFTWSQRALQGWLGGRPFGPSSLTRCPSPSLQTWRARSCGEPRPSDWCLMPVVPTPGGIDLSWQSALMTPHCPPGRKRQTIINAYDLFCCATTVTLTCRTKSLMLDLSGQPQII